MAACRRNRFGSDRQAFDIERVRAIGLQHVPIDDNARGPALLADSERRDDDIGQAAILLERAGIADEGHRLALDHPDAAEQIVAEHSFIRRCGGVAFIGVGQQLVIDAVAGNGRRWKYEIAAPGSERGRGTLALDQHIGPLASRRHRRAGQHEIERSGGERRSGGPFFDGVAERKPGHKGEQSAHQPEHGSRHDDHVQG